MMTQNTISMLIVCMVVNVMYTTSVWDLQHSNKKQITQDFVYDSEYIMYDDDDDISETTVFQDDSTLPAGHQFSATIWPRNEMPAQKYDFQVVQADTSSASFSQVMINGCQQLGNGNWKPVCDHPSYCKNDVNSVYLGQDAHLCRQPDVRFGSLPQGLRVIAHHWRNMCCYTANAGGNQVLCNDPPTSHNWRTPDTKYSYICARSQGEPQAQELRFAAYLGGFNGVEEGNYEFQIMKVDASSGTSFAQIMRDGCAQLGNGGWKPVCDHANYCKFDDNNSLYIGQTSHLSRGSNLLQNTHFPYGYYNIQSKLFGLCSYTNNAQNTKTLCNFPSNSHTWQLPNNKWYYLCGLKTDRGCPPLPNQPFTAQLGAKNGVPARTYSFQIIRAARLTSAKFSQLMIDGCNDLPGGDWKPLCNHPTYCKTDNNAIYIGNDQHLSLPTQRYRPEMMPDGMMSIETKLDGVCTYTNNGNGNNALCNWALNTHTWQPPSTRAAYVCAKVVDTCQNATEEEIVFVMDSSTSIPTPVFTAQKTFVSRVIMQDITLRSQVAVIRFSTKVDIMQSRILMDNVNIRNRVANQIVPSITFVGGATYTYDALHSALQQFSNTNVDTPSKYIILITDGRANGPNKDRLCSLSNNNVRIIVIGIGNNIDITSVQCLLHSNQHYIPVQDWRNLDDVRQQVRSIVCV